jgi:PAS domain S-box-containing protein
MDVQAGPLVGSEYSLATTIATDLPPSSVRNSSSCHFGDVNPSQAQLRIMVDTIPTLAWCCFPDGTIEFLNRRWLEYTGLSQDQGSGFGWYLAVHAEDLGELVKTFHAILASGQPGETEARLRRFDGEYRWFLFRAEPFRDEGGAIVRWYGTNTDIEELKRAQTELRDIVDYVPQQIAILGPDGRRLYANRFALEYAGLSLEEFQSEDYERKMIHPDDLERMKSVDPILHGQTYEFETRIRGKMASTVGFWFASFRFATAAVAFFAGIPAGPKSSSENSPRRERKMKTSLCVRKSTKPRCSRRSSGLQPVCRPFFRARARSLALTPRF